MFSLIKNEYAKIFHKKSTYVFFALLLLFVIAIPVYSKIDNSFSEGSNYYGTVDEELSYTRDYEDLPENNAYIDQLHLMKDLGLEMNVIYSNDYSWIGTALDNYCMYKTDIYLYESGDSSSLVQTDEDKAKFQGYCEGIATVLKNNDWKTFFTKYSSTALFPGDYDSNSLKLINDKYKSLIEENISPDANPDIYEQINSFSSSSTIYTNEKLDEIDYDDMSDDQKLSQADYLLAKYRMENDSKEIVYLEPYDKVMMNSNTYIYTGDHMNSMHRGLYVFTVLALILIIIAGKIFSAEYNNGTIKFLLITPVKRYKIFWSKFITVISLGAIIALLIFFLEFIISSIIFGTFGLDTPLLEVTNGVLNVKSSMASMVSNYCFSFLEILIPVLIAFMLSALFRNSAVAIALSILLYSSSSIITTIAVSLSLDFFRYTIFANSSIQNIFTNTFIFPGMTATFSICVILIHVFLLLLISHDAFTRKNV